ncbi:hypothetical protein L6164_018408 [Bauhinia variegata]|uniref:Uncharacterized protein n=1 Tax=Bauhinia variegata TaxID=167791 RepID=A0ACB9NAX0_BAUVA|nr:hypothetical protein L6164_018408 [Bauhinia variegata]
MPPCRVKDEQDGKKRSKLTRSISMRQPSDPVELLLAAKARESNSAETKEHQNQKKEEGRDKAIRIPYLLEAWLVQSCAPSPPPIPIWTSNKSSAEDMKAHIKFWAKAVASNVR